MPCIPPVAAALSMGASRKSSRLLASWKRPKPKPQRMGPIARNQRPVVQAGNAMASNPIAMVAAPAPHWRADDIRNHRRLAIRFAAATDTGQDAIRRPAVAAAVPLGAWTRKDKAMSPTDWATKQVTEAAICIANARRLSRSKGNKGAD